MSQDWDDWDDWDGEPEPESPEKPVSEDAAQERMRFVDADPLYQNGGKFEVAYEPSGLIMCKTIEVAVVPVTKKAAPYTTFIMSLPDPVPAAKTLKVNPASNLAKNLVRKA